MVPSPRRSSTKRNVPSWANRHELAPLTGKLRRRTMPQRRCVNCKRFISNDATFCKSCGAVQPLPRETTSDSASRLPNHGIANEANPSTDSSSAGFGCLVFVAFLFVLFLLTTTCSGPRHRSSSDVDFSERAQELGVTTKEYRDVFNYFRYGNP